ncbi:globin family protein [Thalassolituus sp. LLYu03]|uniref:globin family protein n=1 Tax=Thalassolituus sp. LLYu03 TaxID=3421656 RepID=UPI003D2AF28D
MITEKQKQLVRETFAAVEPIADTAAELFYGKLFEYDPSLKALFKGDMKQQGRKLMAALKLAVATLDNLDKLVPVLQQMAVKHLDYGVKVDDYTPVGNALLYALKTGLADAYTDDVKEAWTETYRVVATVMRQAAYDHYDPDTYQNHKHYHH